MSTCAPGKVKSELFYKNSRQIIYIRSPVVYKLIKNQIIENDGVFFIIKYLDIYLNI